MLTSRNYAVPKFIDFKLFPARYQINEAHTTQETKEERNFGHPMITTSKAMTLVQNEKNRATSKNKKQPTKNDHL